MPPVMSAENISDEHNYSTKKACLSVFSDHAYCSIQSTATAAGAVHDHDYCSIQNTPTAAGMVDDHGYSSSLITETVASAPDPDIEIFSDKSIMKKQGTPAAAWILVCLLLLHTLKNSANSSVIHELFQLYSHTLIHNSKANKPYSRSMMIFCMTMAGYSTRAYKYLREVAKNCLPTTGTLRKYRKRVDGSPGISAAALQMITRQVNKLKHTSQRLFISLSCDDMSIMQNVWFTG